MGREARRVGSPWGEGAGIQEGEGVGLGLRAWREGERQAWPGDGAVEVVGESTLGLRERTWGPLWGGRGGHGSAGASHGNGGGGLVERLCEDPGPGVKRVSVCDLSPIPPTHSRISSDFRSPAGLVLVWESPREVQGHCAETVKGKAPLQHCHALAVR